MEEAIQIIKLLWTQDAVTFKGKYYGVENAYCNPKPDPLPPILIGGNGEKLLLKSVARYADWWNGAFLDVKSWTHKLNVLANHCDTVGRDFDDILKSVLWGISIAESEEDALKFAKQCVQPLEWMMIGTPDSLVSRMGELVDAGVEYFQLPFTQFPNYEAMQLFADKVIPELA